MNEQRKHGEDHINREGARRYAEGAKANARSGRAEEQAREAAQALDGPEGEKLREAERAGKSAKHRPVD